jgi:3-hydroxybutyryl-CoA dehydrogenase
MEAQDLKRHLVVAGTGRMGLDSGLFFLRRGWRVTWLSGTPARRDEFDKRIARELQRLTEAEPEAARAGDALVGLFDAPGAFDESAPDLFLEAVREDVAQKRIVFSHIAPLLAAQTPLATISSSILPGEIHPRCLGAHGFFPLEITRLVEVVAPHEAGDSAAEALLEILMVVGLHAIVQTPANAFAVNRLLLPLQAEAVRALRSGWPAAAVDAASATRLVPFGQLALMDAVGLDVIAAAVANYSRRLPPGEARDYAELGETLQALLAAGKRGRKNRDGFLSGSPLPWAGGASGGDAAALALDFGALATNACSRAIDRGEISAEGLDLAFSSLFATTVPLDEERRRSRDERQFERLERLHRESGRSYFTPGPPCRAVAVEP